MLAIASSNHKSFNCKPGASCLQLLQVFTKKLNRMKELWRLWIMLNWRRSLLVWKVFASCLPVCIESYGLKACRHLGRFACAINEMHDDALQCAQRPWCMQSFQLFLQSLPARSTLEEEDHHHPAVNVHIKHYANLSLRSHHFPVWICSNGPLHSKAAVIRGGLCEPVVFCSRTDTRSETSQRSAEARVASACRLEFGPSSSPSLPPPPRPFTESVSLGTTSVIGKTLLSPASCHGPLRPWPGWQRAGLPFRISFTHPLSSHAASLLPLSMSDPAAALCFFSVSLVLACRQSISLLLVHSSLCLECQSGAGENWLLVTSFFSFLVVSSRQQVHLFVS